MFFESGYCLASLTFFYSSSNSVMIALHRELEFLKSAKRNRSDNSGASGGRMGILLGKSRPQVSEP